MTSELDLFLVRLEWAVAAIGDLEAKLPVLRRDVRALIADLDNVGGRTPYHRNGPPQDAAARPTGASESPQDRTQRHVQAVEAVLRRRFGGALELSAGYWHSTAVDVIAAAEVGV